jgi:hypothetical protein
LTLDIDPSSIPKNTDRLYVRYFPAVTHACRKHTIEATMNSLGYEYQSDFARRYVAQGKAEGRMEIILKLLASRFGPLTEVVHSRIRSADSAQIDAMADRMLTARALEEVLGPLP